MKVVFRSDASHLIGSGHLMRCLTLAGELGRRGAEVSFVCRSHPGDLIAFLEHRGYPVLALPAAGEEYRGREGDLAHAPWLGVSWERDADDTAALLEEIRPDWLVVDHYALDRRWEQRLRPLAGRILVIDDLADREHDCDLLLDQNLYRDSEGRYAGLVPPRCQRLLGPKYALLRPEFLEARHKLEPRQDGIRRVLVFFGGVDASNETEKALKALAGCPELSFEVDVVVGGGNPHQARIRELCDRAGFRYLCQVEQMAELMARADLAIGAGGTATWERCALGLPALVLSLAQNQVELARCGAEAGLFLYLGEAATLTDRDLADALRVLCRATPTLRAFATASQALVDARGTQRVAGLMAPPEIALRRAQERDCDAIYQWRNAPETRRYIFDAGVIPIEQHRAWFRSALANPDRIILIGETAGRPVGVLRYDVRGEQALISVYLVPGAQGQGVGTELIRSGSRWLRANRPELKRVNAEIMRVNQASLRAFAQAGYQEHHVTYQEVLP